MKAIQPTRLDAAAAANAEDASIWRWFSALLEDRRIRWRYMFDTWVVHVDRTRVAAGPTFDEAIRAAKYEAEQRGLGQLDEEGPHRGPRRHACQGDASFSGAQDASPGQSGLCITS